MKRGKVLTIYLPEDLYEQISEEAKRTNITKSGLIKFIISRALNGECYK